MLLMDLWVLKILAILEEVVGKGRWLTKQVLEARGEWFERCFLRANCYPWVPKVSLTRVSLFIYYLSIWFCRSTSNIESLI